MFERPIEFACSRLHSNLTTRLPIKSMADSVLCDILQLRIGLDG